MTFLELFEKHSFYLFSYCFFITLKINMPSLSGLQILVVHVWKLVVICTTQFYELFCFLGGQNSLMRVNFCRNLKCAAYVSKYP